MANTVIQLKRSTTSGVTPSSLAVGELAVNLPDRKLFVGNGTAVYELGLSSGGTNTQIQFNDSGQANGSATFTYNKTTDTVSLANTLSVGNATINAVVNSTSLKFANSTTSITITNPNTTQANGSHYLNGNGSWVVVTGGSGTPGGANTQVQFNDSGAFGGNAFFTFDKTTSTLRIANSTSNLAITVANTTAWSNGNFYLNANGSWVAPPFAIRQTFTANSTVNTSFAVSGGYTPNQIDVFMNGVKLVNGTDVTVTSGANVVLATAAVTGDIIEVIGQASVIQPTGVVRQTFTANATVNTTFTVTGGYTPNQIDVYLNGAKLVNGTDVTVTSGTSVVLAAAAAVNDIVDVVGIVGAAVYGSGTPGGSNGQIQFNNNATFGASANLIFDTANNILMVGGSITPTTTTRTHILANANTYNEFIIKNSNTGNFASADITLNTNDANDTFGYLNLGINSNTFANASQFAYGPRDGYLYSSNSHLWIGTASANAVIIHANGTIANNEVARFTSAGMQVGNDTVVGVFISTAGALTFNAGQATSPAAPNAGILTIYSANVAGRYMASAIGNSGINYQFQPHLGRNRFQIVNIVDNTALPTGLNTGVANTGAFTARALATGNTFVSARRTGIVTAATANISTEARGTRATYYLGNAAGEGGFHFFVRAGTAAFQTTASVFVGLHTGTATIGNIALTAIRTGVGFGINPGTNNWVVFCANATAANTVDLGVDFPANTATTDMYEFMMFAKPNSSTVNYRVVNVRTGNDTSGTMNTACMPAVNTLMTWKVYLNNGANATAAGVDLSSLYIESDNSG